MYRLGQLPAYPLTHLPNYPITQLPNYPLTQSHGSLSAGRIAPDAGELLRLAEHRHRDLRLRVDHDQVLARCRDAEHRFVDPVTEHRADEVDVLLERVLVDLDLAIFQLLAKFVQHRIVDREVRRDDAAAGG